VNILIVDDEANLRRMLRAVLEGEGHRVEECEDAEAGLLAVSEARPDVILLDVALPGASGLDSLPRYRQKSPGTPVVMMSGEATLSDAARATRDGAFHFLEKPLSTEAVLATVRAAQEVLRARDLVHPLGGHPEPDELLVGTSRLMQHVREAIRRLAPTEARVLITGESGTGKELAASAIHALSGRADAPFIRVNSAAIPRELVESEMFGHERGAFTGAIERRRGRFELASGGTLFLDEVGDLGGEAQAKLLRALESGTIQRVGSATPIEVDVRVLAATNRDLHAAVGRGEFREDLLFRLEVIPLHLPPLRERPEDLPLLIHHIAKRLLTEQGLHVPELSPSALEALRSHPWPGNVRELINLLERLAILHPDGPVDRLTVREHLGPARPTRPDSVYQAGDERPLGERLDAFERDLIMGALDASGGNVAEAARSLSTDRGNLYRRMKRLGVERDT
jgi:two-component system, NtrC family, nitrogen regulation response regulator NtrX